MVRVRNTDRGEGVHDGPEEDACTMMVLVVRMEGCLRSSSSRLIWKACLRGLGSHLAVGPSWTASTCGKKIQTAVINRGQVVVIRERRFQVLQLYAFWRLSLSSIFAWPPIISESFFPTFRSRQVIDVSLPLSTLLVVVVYISA
ncbi:hypothetical protein BDP27DRAFT_1328772 [Rhodocollybia butyracea]|uniref:Uncharacterized protein n=1 Tax=Rhodocollybia butyracea TaxID=206335 RepID=A0A9P5PS73_9AGAR|nr:hypothetical protein BDP27DRAFT_1328772 [Rhodocollybia butyracea]